VPTYEVQSDRVIEESLAELRRRFRIAVALLVITVVISTGGFVVLGRHEGPLTSQIFLALWDTLNLVSTVGNLQEQFTSPQRVWAMLVMMFGLGAVLYGFSTLQGMLHGGDVFRLYARRRMQKSLATMSDHIIVCGYGHVGLEVARELTKHGRDLIVIESGDQRAAAADQAGYVVIHADCTEERVLREAGVERAAGLIAALGKDASNVYLCLIARQLQAGLRIISRAERHETRPLLHRAGADRVIVPGELAGLQLSHHLLKPQVSDFIAAAAGEGEFEFSEIIAAGHAGLVGRSLRELNLPGRAGAIVIAVVDEAGLQTFNPGPDHVVQQSDILLVVCQEHGAKAVAEMFPETD
jgi:voltage-gated potassium channel